MSEKIVVPQVSFGAGEVTPALYGRIDLAKYRAAARAMRNMFSLVTGGASNRPGTTFVGRCKASSLLTPPRLINFQFSTLQSYILEFGPLYMRVIMNGGYVLEPTFAITGITQANPGVITAAGHNFSNGDWVSLASVGGMTQINSFQGAQQYAFIVANANQGGGTFTLTDLDGNAINTTAYSAYTSGGTVARIFTLTTPYAAADLPLLKFTQTADVMTLTHPSYTPQQLTRTQHWAWTLSAITYAAVIQVPTAVTVTAKNNTGTGIDFYYVVTSVNDKTGEESVATAAASVANKGALNQTTGVANDISWTAPATGPAPSRYYVYGAHVATGSTAPTVFGYLGQTTGTEWEDLNVAPDFSNCPPTHQNPFAGSNNPGATNYYQGRQVFGGSATGPDTVWMSKTDNFSNMDTSSPPKDDDALTLALASQQVNAIKHLIALAGAELVLTSSGAWQISAAGQSASNTSAITPSTAQAIPQAYVGCSDVPPIAINYDVLYVEGKQSAVRDLTYNFFVNLFTGDDKSVLASHLMMGRQIQQWSYAHAPFKVIWCVRDDGVLLGFTFLKEQDVYAWSRHDTLGLFESVSVASESQEDVPYFIVTRIVPGVNGGNPVQYVERMHTRNMGANLALGIKSDVSLAWFVDCGLGYGPMTVTTANLYPGVGACNGGTNNVTFYADQAGTFNSGMVGNVIRANGGIGTIATYVDSQHVTVNVWPWAPFAAFPNDPNMLATPPQPVSAIPLPALSGNWSNTTPVGSLGGYAHLNGLTVAILADGNVMPSQVVSNGQIVLPNGLTASVIAIGIPYQAQLMTMNLDVGNGQAEAKRKRVGGVTLMLQDTRGLKVGPVKLNGDTANLPALVEIKEFNPAAMHYGQPIPLATGYEHVVPMPLWQKEGVIMIQQDNPLPCTLLSHVPEVVVGDDPG